MKRVAILGSTGSIGCSTLDVIRKNEDMKATVLAAGSNVDLLLEQIKEFKPYFVCVFEEEKAKLLAERLKLEGIYDVQLSFGIKGLIEAATYPESDIVVTSVVGMIGIEPTIAAIKKGKDIALANKETLVAAGHLMMPLVEERGIRLLPVDSEHSAIFQSLQGYPNPIRKILLTASGGPFLHKKKEELGAVRVEDALKHPNWNMGAKITIDSSTMINKGLEVIEAKWLFGVAPEQIEVVIHPQSILHSAVEFADGGVIGQFGLPDMKLPISYALTYPERRFVSERSLDLFELGSLTFLKPDLTKFRGLKLAYLSLNEGGSLPTVFNAANEAAVSLFLKRKISYLGIVDMIERELQAHKKLADPNLEEILAIKNDIFLRYQN